MDDEGFNVYRSEHREKEMDETTLEERQRRDEGEISKRKTFSYKTRRHNP